MEGQSNIVTLFQQAVKVITSPGEFYRAMQKTGGFADPLIFVLVMAAIAGLEIALFSLFGASVIGTVAAGYGAVIFLPLTAAIGSFIGAALVFVVWRLMGSDENYETAYRCIAYAAAIYPITVLISLLPYIGTIVSVAWGCYLMVIASLEVHRLKRQTVYIVFGVLALLGILLNLSSERAVRHMAAQVDELEMQAEQFGKQLERLEDMTPEEAGRAVGGFLKGLGEAAEGMAQESEDGAKANEARSSGEASEDE